MDRVLLEFIDVLRNADIRVSTAETMDAAEVAALIGYGDKSHLRSALAQVLAKSPHDKALFEECFAQFFRATPWAGDDDALGQEESPDDCPLSESGEGEIGEGDASGEGSGEANAGDGNVAPLGDMQEEVPAEGSGVFYSTPEEQGAGDTGDEGRTNLATAIRLSQLQTAGLSTSAGALPSLLRGDVVDIALLVERAARQISLDQIAFTTQRGLYQYRLGQALEIDTVLQATRVLEQSGDRAAARLLKQREQLLRQTLADKVEGQLLLYSNAASRALREDILKQANLSRIEQRSFEAMQVLVRKMAKKLEARHRRRRNVERRGQLNVPQTIRKNIAHQGVLFNTYWKTEKKERPELFALCDVSGSVSAYSKFLLMFLYSLTGVVPKARAFAFSSNLGEVTELFQQYSVEKAIELANQAWGYGSTDYGQSFIDFSCLALDDVRSSSTVIILGDARNNYGDAQIELLRKIYHRCARLIWLNPEPKGLWRTGDSEMPRYLSCVHQASTCQSLNQLEGVVSQLLRAAE